MKRFTYELLAQSKTKNEVIVFLTEDRLEANNKAKTAARKGFSVLVIKHEGRKRTAVQIGPKVDWTQYSKIVTVMTDSGMALTYRCRRFFEVNDNFCVNTPKGIQHVTVVSETRYINSDELFELVQNIGYIKFIEGAIVA